MGTAAAAPWFGIAAGTLGLIGLVLQYVEVQKSERVEGVSIEYLGISLATALLWIVHSWINASYVALVFGVLELVLGAVITVLTVKKSPRE